MGSNDMPELGSRISLISKADIRYEGKLFTVDPQECTIALANVRSFGTEERETAHPVPPQAQPYNYILFRATDIKDISVIPPQQPVLYDPAIVQLSGGPSSSQGGYGGGGTGSSLGYSSNVPSTSGLGGFSPMHSGLGALHSIRQQAPPPSELSMHHSSSISGDLLTGSRSSTPGVRKVSLSMDQSIQAKLSPPKEKTRTQQQNTRNVQPVIGQQRSNTQPQQRSYRNDTYRSIWGGYGHQNTNQQRWPTNNRSAMPTANRPQMQSGGGGMHRGGINTQRGRNFSRGGGLTQKKQLKFDTDYDFDKANTEFEELRNTLAKIKIGEAEVVQQNGENGGEKKDDSGNETAVGDPDHEEQQSETFYDKSKSFFDKISCEAIERSKGRSQRMDWRKERKLNSETFGVSMARRQAGGGRGARGGWRGGTNYFRGGFRGYNNRQQTAPTTRPRGPPALEMAKA